MMNDLSQNLIRLTSIMLRSNFQKETDTEVPLQTPDSLPPSHSRSCSVVARGSFCKHCDVYIRIVHIME